MKKFFFLLAFVLPLTFAFTDSRNDDVTCDTPTNVRKTHETATTISFAWDAMLGASGYVVKYVRQSDGLTSGDIIVTANSCTYTNMAAGIYDFYFSTKCGGTTSTAFIVIDDINGF